MFILNIIDSKNLKTDLRRLFVDHHAEYDFSDSEEDFCELIELTNADTILMQSEYEDVQGRYILNHILKFCPAHNIQKTIVLYDDDLSIPFDLKITPPFEVVYHPTNTIDDTLLEKLDAISPSTDNTKATDNQEPKRILYVSDDHFMQVIVQDLIHQHTDYEIITANNGIEGLEKYEDYHPNLVLTDLVMPELNGMDLCKEIKINHRDDLTDVIIFSSTADETTIEKAYRLKAKAYIVKPIKPDRFLRKINRILT